MEDALYTVDWNKVSAYEDIGEYKVPLPAMPPLSSMINFGLPLSEQKFKRIEVPKTLLKKRTIVEDSEDEKFILGEYHKRENGEWQIIKGNPIYLTGSYYMFLNYWTTQGGKRPDFLIAQQRMYLFDEFCLRDPHCYGGYFIKARRIGGTEMTLADQYDFATRYRNVFCGMQSKNETSVKKNYNRMLKAHKNMIWFFKASNTGSTANQEGLFFNYPPEQNTARKARDEAESGGLERESIYEDPELGSMITYGPSVATHYDGEELHKYTLNEFGKLENMSLLLCWDKVKPTLHRNNGKYIVGKAKFESTIEQISDSQLQEINEMWHESDPNNRNDNGRTLTGLYRVFFNALDCADPDEWGYPKREEDLRFLENEFKALAKAGNTKKIAELKRKTPLVIEDALTPSGDQCAFNKDNLIESLANLDFPEKGKDKPTTRGNLMWENGNKVGRVIFERNAEGLFEFSMLAGEGRFQDNHVGWFGPERIPLNVNKIRIGIDPYDHKEVVDNRKSKGGAVGGLMYDDLKDGAKVNEDGKPLDLAKEWETFQPIFTYYHRRADPQDFFEDMLMAAVYCGAPVLFENNKQSIRNHFVNRGYTNFIMKRPEGTMSAAQRQGVLTDGIPASENTIQQYYDAIDTYISRCANAIKHRELIVDLLAMNRQNHGKHDLGVAFGWLLIAMTKKYAEVKAQEAEPAIWYEEYAI